MKYVIIWTYHCKYILVVNKVTLKFKKPAIWPIVTWFFCSETPWCQVTDLRSALLPISLLWGAHQEGSVLWMQDSTIIFWYKSICLPATIHKCRVVCPLHVLYAVFNPNVFRYSQNLFANCTAFFTGVFNLNGTHFCLLAKKTMKQCRLQYLTSLLLHQNPHQNRYQYQG